MSSYISSANMITALNPNPEAQSAPIDYQSHAASISRRLENYLNNRSSGEANAQPQSILAENLLCNVKDFFRSQAPANGQPRENCSVKWKRSWYCLSGLVIFLIILFVAGSHTSSGRDCGSCCSAPRCTSSPSPTPTHVNCSPIQAINTPEKCRGASKRCHSWCRVTFIDFY